MWDDKYIFVNINSHIIQYNTMSYSVNIWDETLFYKTLTLYLEYVSYETLTVYLEWVLIK